MKATEVIARLEELVTDGTIKTTIYNLNGEWSSILVNVEEYNGKNIVMGISNKGADYISRQIAKLDNALHPDKYNHYWELSNNPEQLPALPTQIEVAI